MIVECPHCNKLLQFAETDVPNGKGQDVKCPLCSGVGTLAGAVQNSDTGPVHVVTGDDEKPKAHGQAKPAHPMPSDLTIPEDAFNHFRFPAETESQRSSIPRAGKPFGKLLFAAASILVVVLFATLVNVILPGPRPYDVQNAGLPVGVNFNDNSGEVNR